MTDANLPPGFAIDAASGFALPTRTRRSVLPFEDLNVTDPPLDFPTVATELISALSVLVAQGTGGPRLLKATDNGQLLIAGLHTPSTVLTAPKAPADTTITVADSTGFAPGTVFQLVPVPGPGVDCNGITTLSVPDSTHIQATDNMCGLAYAIGTAVIATQVVILGNQLTNVLLGLDQVVTFPGGTSSPDNSLSVVVDPVGRQQLRTDVTRALDGFLQSGEVTGAAVTINFPAPGIGKRLQLAYLYADMNDTAGGQFDQLEIWKNGVGTGTRLDVMQLHTSAAKQGDRISGPCQALVGDANGTINITLIQGAATCTHKVSAGVYTLTQ